MQEKSSKKSAPILKTYGCLFYESLQSAKQDAPRIKEEAAKVDQLNIVVNAEGNMDDESILSIDPKVKLFAGAAWTLIHERRIADGWYGIKQE